MSKLLIVTFLVALGFTSAYLMNKIPSKIFGVYIFIYDGAQLTPQKGLIGGIPGWAKNGGSNTVVLSFMDPIELQASTTLPKQFQDALNEAADSNLNVMFSIGGWDLQSNFRQTNAVTVATNAAVLAQKYNVGIEIDCEDDSQSQWIQTFITTYRQIIPIGSGQMSAVLTMNVGASPGAFPSNEQVALSNTDNLDWVNVMVYDPELSPDNRQFWDYHQLPSNKMTVARNLPNTCNSISSLSPTFTYQHNGTDIAGIMFWASLSEETCNNATAGAQFCGTSCTDCTAGDNSTGTYECTALTTGCSQYGAICLSQGDSIFYEEIDIIWY